eukprot:895326-Rhodomonas_salina.3
MLCPPQSQPSATVDLGGVEGAGFRVRFRGDEEGATEGERRGGHLAEVSEVDVGPEDDVDGAVPGGGAEVGPDLLRDRRAQPHDEDRDH